MQDMMKERNMDSGLIVVVFIITSLIITVFSFLLFVDYEWCHVLFKNNTVSKILNLGKPSKKKTAYFRNCSEKGGRGSTQNQT